MGGGGGGPPSWICDVTSGRHLGFVVTSRPVAILDLWSRDFRSRDFRCGSHVIKSHVTGNHVTTNPRWRPEVTSPQIQDGGRKWRHKSKMADHHPSHQMYDPHYSYTNVKKKLYTYFGNQKDSLVYQLKLREITRRSNESLQDFCKRVAITANKAYPSSPNERERSGIFAIVSGCRSDMVKHAALQILLNLILSIKRFNWSGKWRIAVKYIKWI